MFTPIYHFWNRSSQKPFLMSVFVLIVDLLFRVYVANLNRSAQCWFVILFCFLNPFWFLMPFLWGFFKLAATPLLIFKFEFVIISKVWCPTAFKGAHQAYSIFLPLHVILWDLYRFVFYGISLKNKDFSILYFEFCSLNMSPLTYNYDFQ